MIGSTQIIKRVLKLKLGLPAIKRCTYHLSVTPQNKVRWNKRRDHLKRYAPKTVKSILLQMRRFSRWRNFLTNKLTLFTPNRPKITPNRENRTKGDIIQVFWWFWQDRANWGNFTAFYRKWGEGEQIKFLKIRFRVRGTSPIWDPIQWSRLDPFE